MPVGGTIAYLATGKEDPKDVKSKLAGGAAASAKKAEAPKAAAAGSEAEAKSSAPVATMEHAARSEVHEPDEVGHGATPQAASPVPPLQHGNGRRIFARARQAHRRGQGHRSEQHQGSGPYGRIVQKDVLEAADKPRRLRAGEGRHRCSRETRGGPHARPRAQKAKTGHPALQDADRHRRPPAGGAEDPAHLRHRRHRHGRALGPPRALNAQLEKQKIRLSIGDLIAKAVAEGSLQQHPAVNAHFDEKNNQIIRFGDVNSGMAVALPDGLIVPVLRSIDQMGFEEIRQRSADLVDRARAQKLKQDEMSGATFTVANSGHVRRSSTPSSTRRRSPSLPSVPPRSGPWCAATQIVPRLTMTVTLSADHRAHRRASLWLPTS